MQALYKKTIAAFQSLLTPEKASPADVFGGGNGSTTSKSFDANSEEIARLKAIITNTYTEVLIYLRTNRGVTGDSARTIAYEYVAKVVSKTTGKNISADYVRQVVSR
ncbi:MAG: hypothetical protein WCJ64_02910 [Rhodospirillaceae bacterium]